MAERPVLKLKKQWVVAAVRPSIWDVGNDWLYKLCATYPSHTDAAQVGAKIWLIGRAYSAAAERGVSGKGQADKYIIELSQRFIDQKADRYLNRLSKPIADFRKHLDQIVDVHHYFESIFSNDDELGRVSLTSKYLHFHRPDLFPIYDSRASTAIARIAPDSRFTGYEVSSEHGTTRYGKFAVRTAWLLDQMAVVLGHTPTLRQLDNLLLQVHRDKVKNQWKG